MMLHERLDAISASRVDGPSKLVLIMLAKRLDRDDPDGVVWSSSETLAEECGVSARAICHTMKRLTAAGIIRIVSKAAQGRTARKAIDWAALAAAERDATAIENIPAEKRRRVRSRSDAASDLEVTDSQTLALRGVTPRSDEPSEDPIIDPPMNPILESDQDTRSDAGEPSPDHTLLTILPSATRSHEAMHTPFCVHCPGDGTHKMSCTPHKSGLVDLHEPCLTRDLKPLWAAKEERWAARMTLTATGSRSTEATAAADSDSATDPVFLAALAHVVEVAGPMLARLTDGPTTPTDAIDNDGAQTPPQVPPAPSPEWVDVGDGWQDLSTAALDAKPGELVIVSGRSTRIRCGVCSDRGWSCDLEQGHDGPHQRGPFAFGASTLTAAPATTPATAPPPSAETGRDVAPRVGPDLPLTEASAFTLSPPSKPKGKRKAATEITEDQIASVAVFVDRIIGKPGRCLPGSTRWKRLTNAIKGAGLSKVYARMEATADAAEGKASPASETWKVMTSRGCTVDNMIWDHNGWTASIDTAIEDAAIDAAERASETTGAAGGVVGRLEPQNRSQGQPAPNPTVSWSDVLRDIGSDPQVHPEDGEHRHRWQSVRQAVIMAIRKPGDPWAAWCNADDPARQRVESLLERGLVK